MARPYSRLRDRAGDRGELQGRAAPARRAPAHLVEIAQRRYLRPPRGTDAGHRRRGGRLPERDSPLGKDEHVDVELTDDQELFRETTANSLDRTCPVSTVREWSEKEPAGFPDAWWQQGAALGWTSLLVSEAD